VTGAAPVFSKDRCSPWSSRKIFAKLHRVYPIRPNDDDDDDHDDNDDDGDDDDDDDSKIFVLTLCARMISPENLETRSSREQDGKQGQEAK